MPPPPEDALRRLLHRWFVEYNPLVLLSAALVLAGVTLLQIRIGCLVTFWDVATPALVAELYAGALLASAALLARVGQMRPAVLLVLMAIVYQADPTFVTDIGGDAGLGVVWLVVFAGKLVAMSGALRLRISGRMLATVLAGAASLVCLSWIAGHGARAGEIVCAAVVLSLGLVRPARLEDAVTSSTPLGSFGTRVLRRSLVFAAVLWGAVLLVRMQLSLGQRGGSIYLVLVALAWACALRVEKERIVWATAALTLGLTAMFARNSLEIVAALATVALFVRAFVAVPRRSTDPANDVSDAPYRAAAGGAVAPTGTIAWCRPGEAERMRLFTGALVAAHLATPAPAGGHLFVWLSVWVALVAWTSWRLHSRVPLVSLLPMSAHALVASHAMRSISTARDWGTLLSAAGFSVLALSVWVTYRLRSPDGRIDAFDRPVAR